MVDSNLDATVYGLGPNFIKINQIANSTANSTNCRYYAS